MIRLFACSFLVSMVCASCNVDRAVTLQSVDGVSLEVDEDFNPILTAQLSLYNASSYTLHLKALHLDILLDDKRLARLDEDLALTIAAKSAFSVPLTIRLTLEEKGLFGKLISIVTGEDYTITCTGHAALSFWGIPITVPVRYTNSTGRD